MHISAIYPKKVYLQIKDTKIQNISGLETYLKRHKLIPIKYTRKWFYSKCIELGIPESIADYYGGRISSSIGSKHYLAKQVLADQFYNKIVEELNNSMKNTYGEEQIEIGMN